MEPFLEQEMKKGPCWRWFAPGRPGQNHQNQQNHIIPTRCHGNPKPSFLVVLTIFWGVKPFIVHGFGVRRCIHTYIYIYIIEGSLNRNFRQYGELKSSSRVVKSVDKSSNSQKVKSVDKRSNSQKVRRKKMRPRQMLEKSRNAVFFQWFVCRVSPKVGLLKRRVRR